VKPSRIILVAQAPNLMFNKSKLSKMSQTLTVSHFFHSILYQFQSKRDQEIKIPLTFACFKNVGLVYTGAVVG
jgi:hypothetical protein